MLIPYGKRVCQGYAFYGYKSPTGKWCLINALSGVQFPMEKWCQ